MTLCALFEEAMRHGGEALADTWLSIVAYDCVGVIVQYLSEGLGTSKQKGETLKTHALAAVHSNIRALKRMVPLHYLAHSLVSQNEWHGGPFAISLTRSCRPSTSPPWSCS